MFYGDNREEIRQTYIEAWRKYQCQQPLTALEQMIVDIILMHPEYHRLLTDPDGTLDRDYTPEHGQSNPFLHMGLHIAIHEQLSVDRPKGIRAAYQRLLRKFQDAHQVEHRIQECLAESLWSAQREGRAPDEQAYLACVQSLDRH